MVTDSTFHSNQAVGLGGGLYIQQEAMPSADLTRITNSTISGNSAGSFGGNLYVSLLHHPLELHHTTVVDGVSPDASAISENQLHADLILSRSIVGGNALEETCDIDNNWLVRDSYNVFSHNFECVGEEDAILNTDNLALDGLGLEPLADNGGAKLTHKPTYGSPAINWVIEDCTGRDQRGVERDQFECEAGAVEYPGI